MMSINFRLGFPKQQHSTWEKRLFESDDSASGLLPRRNLLLIVCPLVFTDGHADACRACALQRQEVFDVRDA